MGNYRVSVLSQRVAKVIPEQHLVLVYGGVPGSKNGIVELRGAVKRSGGRNQPKKVNPTKAGKK
jgi:large subunit ribosomal protein L3